MENQKLSDAGATIGSLAQPMHKHEAILVELRNLNAAIERLERLKITITNGHPEIEPPSPETQMKPPSLADFLVQCPATIGEMTDRLYKLIEEIDHELFDMPDQIDQG